MVKPEIAIPYLPDLLKEIVVKVDAKFSDVSRPEAERFNVFFDYGLIFQVNRSVDKRPEGFPLVWLAFNFEEIISGNPADFLTAKIDLYVFGKTEGHYTMEERDELNFKSRLFPIYQELITQIRSSKVFGKPSETDVAHTRIIRPYWGGGDVNGTNIPNMFKKHVDAVQIQGLKLKIKKDCF